MDDKRRKPKEYLDIAEKEARAKSRGKLKIFLGAAPGVGKTYAMLEEAIIKHNEGIDIVAGVVETHGRKETQVFLEKLEILPKQTIVYRGIDFAEFNLDLALERKPELILVDELAHGNIPGSRHTKRWQDIMELLDRGIDVYTTMNVQHMESLNNIVTQITGLIVRETVPDKILEEANSIELIDLPSDDLIRRLEEGKIYVPSEINIAIEHYFRKSNLSALRELALRVTAEQVDVEVLLYRHGDAIEKIIPVKERLLVCVGAGPHSPRLIRAAFRMAKSLQASWLAVSIETPKIAQDEEKKQKILQHFQLAEQLGGETLLITGTDIVEEILNLAHERNVTKIILGKETRSRWRDFFTRRLADELVRHSIDIDLYILRGGLQEPPPVEKDLSHIKRSKTTPWDYFLSIATVFVCTAMSYFLSFYFKATDLIFIYFIGIIFVAYRGLWWPAFLACILNILLIDFLFLAPKNVLYTSNLQDNLLLLIVLIVSLALSRLGISTRQQVESTRKREQHITAIHLLSKSLAKTRGVEKIISISKQQISEVFCSDAEIFLPDKGGQLFPKSQTDKPLISTKEQSVIQWVYELGQMAGLGTQTLPENEALYIPLLGTRGTVGVLKVKPKSNLRLLLPEQLNFLLDFSNQIAMAIEVDRLQEDAKNSDLQIETEKVRTIVMKYMADIIHAPLKELMELANNILALGHTTHSVEVEKLGSAIYNNSAEIIHLINNISRLARLESSEITLTKNLHSIENVLQIVLKSLARRLKNRPLIISIPETIPRVPFNKVYMEHVFFNILENAIRYTPPTAAIEISAVLKKDRIEISVLDKGPGLASDEINKIFEKFYRGQSIPNIIGMGIGLNYCQRIIHMHGGEIWAENNPTGGAIFRFTLPLH